MTFAAGQPAFPLTESARWEIRFRFIVDEGECGEASILFQRKYLHSENHGFSLPANESTYQHPRDRGQPPAAIV